MSAFGNRNDLYRLSRLVSMAVVTTTLAAICLGCRGGRGDQGNTGDGNFSARQAVTDVLEDERALDENARNIIQLVKDGQYTVDQGLDDLVDVNRNLISLIAEVSAPSKPPNRYLALARDQTAEYLRNRVHQMEACFPVKSVAELEQVYGRDKPALDAARSQIRDLLLKYDPGLDRYVPK